MTMSVFATPGFAQVSFQPATYNSPNNPADIFVADLNKDGKPDIAVTDGNMVAVFLNKGDGTFPDGPSATYLVGDFGPDVLTVADFNGDGILDIATANCGTNVEPPQVPSPGSVSILFGTGTGYQTHVDYPLPSTDCPDAIGFLTVANDSKPSLVVSFVNGGSDITLLRNNNSGTFSEQKIQGPAGSLLRGVSAADYNGDGRDDVAAVMATPNSSIQQVVIFYGNADGSFGPATPVFSMQASLRAATTVGFNGTGRPDLLVPFTDVPGVNQPEGVIALANNGGGNFSSVALNLPHTILPGSKVAEGDLGNGNGLHSIIVPVSGLTAANALYGAFAVFVQQSKGNFLGPIYFAGDSGGVPTAVAVADFNGDKRLDFAANDSRADALEVFQNTTSSSTCPFFIGGSGVHVCMPTVGSSVGSPVPIGASATAGNLPIVAMKAYIDGAQVAATDINTLNAAVAKASGTHQLAVNAWDVNDKVYQTFVNFTVGGTAGCSVPGAAGVHICAPAQGSNVTSPVKISAAANGGTARISAMKAYIDGKQVAASSSGTITGSAAEATGTHKLTVNAWNTAGKVFQSTATFTVH